MVGANRWAVMGELRGAPEPTLDEIIARLSPVDLIVIEGFKGGTHPKIELRRGGTPLDPDKCPNIVAVAENGGTFDPDDIEDIAAFVLDHVSLTAIRA